MAGSAEWVAGSAGWVAGSAVKLGIFSDFWCGASARAKNRKKCFKKFGGISAEMAAENSAEIPQIRKLLRKLLGTGIKHDCSVSEEHSTIQKHVQSSHF